MGHVYAADASHSPSHYYYDQLLFGGDRLSRRSLFWKFFYCKLGFWRSYHGYTAVLQWSPPVIQEPPAVAISCVTMAASY